MANTLTPLPVLQVDRQKLMRVYGALMWSMGKVRPRQGGREGGREGGKEGGRAGNQLHGSILIGTSLSPSLPPPPPPPSLSPSWQVMKTPEVLRVYVGSFWDQPLMYRENKELFEMEENDLMKDLKDLPRYAPLSPSFLLLFVLDEHPPTLSSPGPPRPLPPSLPPLHPSARNSAMRKINELVKRTRLLRVHAYIIGYLKEQMPMFMGREKMQVRRKGREDERGRRWRGRAGRGGRQGKGR